MATAIIMTDADRARWTDPLSEYYANKDFSDAEIQKMLIKVFAEVQTGWERAPRDLDTRIRVKTGFQWKSHENLKPRRKAVEDVVPLKREEDDLSEGDIFKYLSKSEKAWWEERYLVYNKDFEFNNSSDTPLLEQLLVEELIQRRLQKRSLQKNLTIDNKDLNDSLKRISELQTKLGITREQRAGIMNKIDGNVALIAMQLNEKLEKMPERIKADYEEEVYFDSLKKQKPPINILPPIAKIEALLQIDGKLGGEITSDRISEITEEVAKEVTEQRATQKEAPVRELPDGVDISK